MANRHVRAAELERSSLCIPHRTLMNWMTQYRDAGPGALYVKVARHKPRVITLAVVAQCAQLLEVGHRPAAIAQQIFDGHGF
jgi:hypothetical protein